MIIAGSVLVERTASVSNVGNGPFVSQMIHVKNTERMERLERIPSGRSVEEEHDGFFNC